MKKYTCFLLVVFSAFNFSVAQQNKETQQKEQTYESFFSRLKDNSDKQKGVIIINQPNEIENLIKEKTQYAFSHSSKNLVQGYRVQVYSSNASSEAKANAIKENINNKYPDLSVYVTYNSPFWKVKVGDCKTNEEALELRILIKKEFPEYQRELFIIRDKVYK